jgi:hypothetical protein
VAKAPVDMRNFFTFEMSGPRHSNGAFSSQAHITQPLGPHVTYADMTTSSRRPSALPPNLNTIPQLRDFKQGQQIGFGQCHTALGGLIIWRGAMQEDG